MHSAAPYLYPGDIFFRPRRAPETQPFRCQVPSGWSTRGGREWTEYQPQDRDTPSQGWKIHVSAEIGEAEDVLNRVATIAIRHRVVFKHLSDRARFLARNSKLCARVHAGKFITLYPADDALESLLPALEDALIGFRGPYVLSDRRWDTAPIFLRYGAFRPVDGPDGRFVGLITGDGTRVPDKRSLHFAVPDFASRPATLRAWLHELEHPTPETPLPFTAHQALKFSNSGGTYSADYDGRPVVVKEGRPSAGLDPLGRDAVHRLNHEHDVLTAFDGLPGIPRVLARLTSWENTFLIEEQVPGKPLHHWASDQSAFRATSQRDVEARLIEQAAVLDALESAVEAMHRRGWAHMDIHVSNVLVDPSDLRVHLIDFENAIRLEEGSCTQPMAAAGYGMSGCHQPEAFDFQGLRQIALFLLWPAVGDAVLDLHRADHVVAAIRARSQYMGVPTSNPLLAAALDRLDALSARVHALLDGENPLTEQDHSSQCILDRSPVVNNKDEWERALSDGITAARKRYVGTGYPVHHHALSRNWHGLGYGRSILDRLTGSSPQPLGHTQTSLPGLFTGFVGDLVGRGGLTGSDLTSSMLSEILNIEGPRVFDGLPGVLLGLASLPELHEDSGMWQALSDRAAGLARAYLRRPEDFAPVDTPTRTDSPDDHDSGLLYGHLGVAWALSRFLNTGPAIIGDACTQALRAELGRYITVDEGRALLLNQKSRTIPYLAMGSAGFGIVLPGIPRNLWPVEVTENVSALTAACDAHGCVFPGLFNGMAGLQLGRAGLFHAAGVANPSQEPRSVLTDALDLFTFNLDGTAVVQGDGGGRITTDLATGGGGVLLALRGLSTGIFDLIDIVSALPASSQTREHPGPTPTEALR